MSRIESWESHQVLMQLMSDNVGEDNEIPTLARRLSIAASIDWTIRDQDAVHRNMLKGEGGEIESDSRRVALYGFRKSNSTRQTGVKPPDSKNKRR